MKPLVHPAADAITVEGVLHALADPVRVAIFARIVGAAGPRTCSDFLTVSERSIPKSTLSQHFRALREAGLIRSERRGVEMLNTPRCAEVDARFPGLLAAIVNAHNVQNADAHNAAKPARAAKAVKTQKPRKRAAGARVRAS